MKLMPKLFNMISEGDRPHPKGSKKYKAHMAAKHANMSEGKSMEDKIAADIEAGMSTDAIIGISSPIMRCLYERLFLKKL